MPKRKKKQTEGPHFTVQSTLQCPVCFKDIHVGLGGFHNIKNHQTPGNCKPPPPPDRKITDMFPQKLAAPGFVPPTGFSAPVVNLTSTSGVTGAATGAVSDEPLTIKRSHSMDSLYLSCDDHAQAAVVVHSAHPIAVSGDRSEPSEALQEDASESSNGTEPKRKRAKFLNSGCDVNGCKIEEVKKKQGELL
ncbi:hypothetical protein B0H17DRAFT_1331641 [Mycena rosella]|uniref:Uncharacterized protein n=1 Tax=Mycena rosella TaxID=1033263 RepID=A0AAD7DFF4_MYCRO|nr:hypothetical protein B0H17DRAFT_1331641 [Mycena rosella]